MQAPYKGTDGKVRGITPDTAFKESRTCWSNLGYVSMLHYPVRDAAERVLHPGRFGSWDDPQAQELFQRQEVWETFRNWDSNIRLQEERLVPLVREALNTVALWGDPVVE